MDLIEKAAPRDPSSPWTRLGLAIIARSRGQNAQATAELTKLVKEQPGWGTAQMQLGASLLAEKKHDAAMQAFDAAERVSPNKPMAQVQIAQVLLVQLA